MKNFGDRLREARVAAGLTQEQLGFALGVTKSSVSAWENGRETPGFKLLSELRRTLQRSLDELVCGIEPAAPRPDGEAKELRVGNEAERTLLIRYRSLPPRRREAVLELLKPASSKSSDSER